MKPGSTAPPAIGMALCLQYTSSRQGTQGDNPVGAKQGCWSNPSHDGKNPTSVRQLERKGIRVVESRETAPVKTCAPCSVGAERLGTAELLSEGGWLPSMAREQQ
jgi:hypothetical protein